MSSVESRFCFSYRSLSLSIYRTGTVICNIPRRRLQLDLIHSDGWLPCSTTGYMPGLFVLLQRGRDEFNARAAHNVAGEWLRVEGPEDLRSGARAGSETLAQQGISPGSASVSDRAVRIDRKVSSNSKDLRSSASAGSGAESARRRCRVRQTHAQHGAVGAPRTTCRAAVF